MGCGNQRGRFFNRNLVPGLRLHLVDNRLQPVDGGEDDDEQSDGSQLQGEFLLALCGFASWPLMVATGGPPRPLHMKPGSTPGEDDESGLVGDGGAERSQEGSMLRYAEIQFDNETMVSDEAVDAISL